MTRQEVKQISIRLLPDGFSYLNEFHPIQPGADFDKRLEDSLLETLTEADDNLPELGVCSVENVRFCLSPLEVGDEIAASMYEANLPTSDKEETTLILKDENNGIRFTFGLSSELYHFILRNWTGIEFTHPLFSLYQEWAEKEEVRMDCMVAEAGDSYLNLLIFRDGKLYLCNRYEVSETENKLYHLMNSWTQCGLDVLDNKLYLITDSDEFKQSIKQYIKQCES